MTEYTVQYRATLIAIPVEDDSCTRCKFDNMHNCESLRTLIGLPDCSGRLREDGKNVIFIEKQL